MGRAYSSRPSDLLDIDDRMEALFVDARCYMQGKREEAEMLRRAGRDKRMVFPNIDIMRA